MMNCLEFIVEYLFNSLTLSFNGYKNNSPNIRNVQNRSVIDFFT